MSSVIIATHALPVVPDSRWCTGDAELCSALLQSRAKRSSLPSQDGQIKTHNPRLILEVFSSINSPKVRVSQNVYVWVQTKGGCYCKYYSISKLKHIAMTLGPDVIPCGGLGSQYYLTSCYDTDSSCVKTPVIRSSFATDSSGNSNTSLKETCAILHVTQKVYALGVPCSHRTGY